MKASKQSYLSFKLADEIFAISVHSVLEVLEYQNITKVPKAPEYIRGVINFRGEILPVIETRKKFNMPEDEEIGKSVIIVLELDINKKHTMLGAIADGVNDVLDFGEDVIRKVPEMGSRYNTEFLNGMVKTDDGFIMILNINKVFSADEIHLIQETHEQIDEHIANDEKEEGDKEEEKE